MKYVMRFLLYILIEVLCFITAFVVIFCVTFFCIANFIWSLDYKGTIKIKDEMYSTFLSDPIEMSNRFMDISIRIGIVVAFLMFLNFALHI